MHASPHQINTYILSVLFLCLATLLAAPSSLHAQSWVAAVSKWESSFGLKSDGSLWGWGSNYYGETGGGSWDIDIPTPTLVGQDFAAVVAGSDNALALKTDHSLWSWGNYKFESTMYFPEHASPPDACANTPVYVGDGYAAASSGYRLAAVVKLDGSLWLWARAQPQPEGSFSNPVCLGQDFVAVASGYSHSFGLQQDGSLWAWGDNYHGSLGTGDTADHSWPVQVADDFVAIAAGYHSLGLKSDGSLWAWGGNSVGQLGDGSTTDRHSPVPVGSEFSAIAAGGGHSLGLKTDGTLWAWGGNEFGQLGIGNKSDRHTPVQVGGGFRTLVGGVVHSLAIKEDGSLWAWGDNGYGQLGDGTFTKSLVPKLVDAGSGPGYSYYVPYAPDLDAFGLGFGISNPDTTNAAGVTLEYFNNNGVKLFQEFTLVPAGGHASFMRGLSYTEDGWARITASTPIQGMALCFGHDQDPLFDMDFKDNLGTELQAAHVDTSGDWLSRAMLANPGPSAASVTLTFRPNAGLPIQTADITIPALGAIQYDLSQSFPDATGSLSVATNQPGQGLAGFILYDGRAKGYNYVGGLSMQ